MGKKCIILEKCGAVMATVIKRVPTIVYIPYIWKDRNSQFTSLFEVLNNRFGETWHRIK